MTDFTKEEARREYLRALFWAVLLLLLGGTINACRAAYHPRKNPPSWQAREAQLETPTPRQ